MSGFESGLIQIMILYSYTENVTVVLGDVINPKIQHTLVLATYKELCTTCARPIFHKPLAVVKTIKATLLRELASEVKSRPVGGH